MSGTSIRTEAVTAALAGALALALLLAPGAAALEPSAHATERAAGKAGCPAATVHARAGVKRWISLRCPGSHGERIQIVKAPRHGLLGPVRQKRQRVAFRPHRAFEGRDRLIAAHGQGPERGLTRVRIRVNGDPVCRAQKARANYDSPVTVSLTCRGAGLKPIDVASGPASGSLGPVAQKGGGSRRILTVTHTPDSLFVGRDRVRFAASDADGRTTETARIRVLPWRMRALGDSVTAGFGYFSDGSLMSVDQLPDCKPAAKLSNRCSSNSPDGPGYTGKPEWTADYGLANDVSWAAQFANDWQGGGHITAPQMFRNYAVTGSAPSDWLQGGILNQQLMDIVAEDPDLIAFTLGANPLLTDLLLTVNGEECSFEDTVAELRACLEPFFTQVKLVPRLQQVYTALLAAPSAEVVTFQYHLSIPAANLFDVWQLETMIDFFNEQISTAVANTKAALPSSQAQRLHLVEAQTDPQSPSPQLVPRFNIGLPPAAEQTWTAGYDCGVIFTDDVDGESHQSDPTQDELLLEEPDTFCSGDEWIIGADTGIHPNAAGYAQFAATLANVAADEGLIPPLP